MKKIKFFMRLSIILAINVIYLFINVSNTGDDITSIRMDEHTAIRTDEHPATQVDEQTADEIPAGIACSGREGLFAGGYIDAFVIKVVDGDTIDVKKNGKIYRVRLLDVDTPESVKEGIRVQAYAKKATTYTENTVLNRCVKLVFGKNLRDKYGRLLAYIFINDKVLVNALLIANGYARVEIIPPNIEYADYFYKLQERAIKGKIGLWGLPAGEQPFIKDDEGDYIPKYWLDEEAS